MLRTRWTSAVVPGVLGDLEFRVVADQDERREAFDLRARVFERCSDYLIDAHPGLHSAEDPHDAVAHQFLCRLGGEAIAAARFGPALAGRFEAEELARLPSALAEMREETFQVSRVVVREDVRKRQVSEAMLQLACRWLSEHTPIRHYFALCLPRLAQFYEHFGAEWVTREPFVVPARRGNSYVWIRGEHAHTAATIRAYLDREPRNWDFAGCRLGLAHARATGE
ncbi:MAG: hypothetical protein L6Q99_01925 [Planctomycetes bacterium]|nr:hypothetical protein [Planctomycetota bacterium]